MRRVALVYNPASGRHSFRHHSAVDKAIAVLRAAGVQAEAFETQAPGDAEHKAREAIRRGHDTIYACGGDGTVNEVLQAVVGTSVVLGVVPLGTANALAANLGIPRSPEKAVRALLKAQPVRISVGRIHCHDETGAAQTRYFTVTAGVGADALFLSHLDPALKRRFGYILYLIEGFKVWVRYKFPLFEVEFAPHGESTARVERVSQLLAVRIRDFGGVVHNIAPGASLRSDRLRLVAFKTRSRMHYFRYVLATVFGRPSASTHITLADVETVECRASNGSSELIFAEADGEVLGRLPARIEIVPDAVTLLVPAGARL